MLRVSGIKMGKNIQQAFRSPQKQQLLNKNIIMLQYCYYGTPTGMCTDSFSPSLNPRSGCTIMAKCIL